MVTMRVALAGTSSRYASVADGLARLGFGLVTANVLVSTVVGIIGVVAWHDAGTGPGGGWGVPGMALLLAAALGIPSFLLGIIDIARGRWHCAGRLLTVAGPFFIFLGFFFGSHLLDPCARGWVDPQSGSCEWSHGTWNVHERYHLLYHALVPTAGLVALYVALFRRWYPDVTSRSQSTVERTISRMRMARVAFSAPSSRRWISLAAVVGGLLWIPYGVCEMLQPWGVDAHYRDDKGYEVVTDAVLYRVYTLPGSLSLLLTAMSLLGISSLLALPNSSTMRISHILSAIAAALGTLSLAGVIAGFDPLFTGPRIVGTLLLGAAALLTGLSARRANTTSDKGMSLIAAGLLGLFLFPLWPLVYAVEIIPAWLGAVIIALFGLGWVLAGYRLWPHSSPLSVAR